MKIQDLTDKDVVHCPSLEEALLFCNELHRLGKKWANRKSYKNNTEWKSYNYRTCYSVAEGLFANIEFWNEENYNVIPFSEIELGEYYGLKVGDVLPKNVISEWSKNEACYYHTEWTKSKVSFKDDRKIKSFKVLNGILGFEVSGTLHVFLKAEGFKEFKEFMDSYSFPEKWYLPLTDCTDEQLKELNQWRINQPGSKYEDYRICKEDILLSVHRYDHSYYYSDSKLPNFYDDYTEITLEQFYKNILNKNITNKNIMNNRFPFKLTEENAKKIISMACKDWRKELSDLWGSELLLNGYVMVSEEYYNKMRKACTKEQNSLFDEIFGKDSREIDLTKPDTFHNLKLFSENESCPSLVRIRKLGNYINKGFYLNKNFNWEIVRDDKGLMCLIPTKKEIW